MKTESLPTRERGLKLHLGDVLFSCRRADEMARAGLGNDPHCARRGMLLGVQKEPAMNCPRCNCSRPNPSCPVCWDGGEQEEREIDKAEREMQAEKDEETTP